MKEPEINIPAMKVLREIITSDDFQVIGYETTHIGFHKLHSFDGAAGFNEAFLVSLINNELEELNHELSKDNDIYN